MNPIPKPADISPRLADFDPERICLEPIPGTATKEDIIAAEAATGRLYELIDGTLVKKTVGWEECFLGSELAAVFTGFRQTA